MAKVLVIELDNDTDLERALDVVKRLEDSRFGIVRVFGAIQDDAQKVLDVFAAGAGA